MFTAGISKIEKKLGMRSEGWLLSAAYLCLAVLTYAKGWNAEIKEAYVKMKDTCTEWTRDASHKDGFPRVQRLRSIHHKIAVVQVPRADLDLSYTKPTRFISRNKLHYAQFNTSFL